MRLSGLGALTTFLFLQCTPTDKTVILPSYREVYASELNAKFIEEYREKYGCIGVAQRALQEESTEKMEARAKLNYAEHCRGLQTTLNLAQNGDVTIAYQPQE